MGVSSSAGSERPAAALRSIRGSFIVRVAVPAACLLALGGLAAGAELAGRGFATETHRERITLALLAGAGLVVVAATVALVGSFARRLSLDVAELTAAAQRLADEQLPQMVERLRGGEPAAEAAGSTLRSRQKIAELAAAATAIASLEHAAVTAAAGEAGLRNGLRQVFVSLARRNQSLLHRQLRLIDALEQKASDPAALADLFALDHLTTRMRRHAESLTILSGAAPGRSWSEPVPVIDVIRAATAEVEDYRRVTVLTTAEDAVSGSAVADMIHLLAELIENATLFSPSGTRVEVRAERVANGFAVEVDDRGLGMDTDQLAELNQQLATPPDFDLANADRLGLFVGGKLAARHGIRVSLRPSPYGGTTAIVLMPTSIVVPAAEPDIPGEPAARQASRSTRLDLGSAEPLALTRPRAPQPSLAAASQRAARPDSPAGPAPDSAAGPAPDSAAGPGPGSPAGLAPVGQQAAATYRGLPRRTRQASLSPHLRESPAAADTAAPAPSRHRDADRPEEARSLAASLQSGWQRGRQADPADAPGASPATGPRPVRRPDPEAPHSEEA
jgi:signal transduction histidine kinase